MKYVRGALWPQGQIWPHRLLVSGKKNHQEEKKNFSYKFNMKMVFTAGKKITITTDIFPDVR